MYGSELKIGNELLSDHKSEVHQKVAHLRTPLEVPSYTFSGLSRCERCYVKDTGVTHLIRGPYTERDFKTRKGLAELKCAAKIKVR